MTDKLWEKYESYLLNNGISERRRIKLKMVYHIIHDRAFKNKDLTALQREDIEKFITLLNRNQFKREDGKDYSGLSKKDIKTFMKQFWKWLKGENEYYPPEVSWINTRINKDERKVKDDVLTYQQTIKFSQAFQKIEYRMLVLILFDSGFRIMELLSVRKQDLTFEEYDTGKSCFWIKCQKSKTYTRKIPIPLFTEDITTFMNSSYMESRSDNDLLFSTKYGAINKCLREVGQKLLKKRIYPHLFRHSSATYYAEQYKGDRMQLAQRYGWSLSSDELETYVRMSENYKKQGVKQVYSNETAKLQMEVEELKKQINIANKWMWEQQNALEKAGVDLHEKVAVKNKR